MVKVCGMRDADNIRALESAGFVDLMGFIFYDKSPRFAGCEPPEYLPQCPRVGVFVNPEAAYVRTMVQRFGLSLVQLHGDETPAFCREISASVPEVRLIKAFRLRSTDDLVKTAEYEDVVDYFLFDTPTPGYGGSGLTFDWTMLDGYNGHTPFLLSGGIGPDSLTTLSQFSHPMFCGVDLNSRFEILPGVKDIEALKTFIQQLTFANN